LKKTLSAILVGATLAGSAISSPNADEFRAFLETADCTSLEADHAIDLRVFDRKFPLAKGFFFAGHEVEGVTFRKNSDVSPLEYMQQNPDVSPKDVVALLSAQQVSVVYSSADQEGGLTEPGHSTFEHLAWNGLSLLYRSSDGGRQVESTTYQVIVGDTSQSERLLITATNPARIAEIVACAKKID
jgi:hypothetical protein